MNACTICRDPIEGPRLTDANGDAHPACAVAAIPQDAVVALLTTLALILLPPVVVWAGCPPPGPPPHPLRVPPRGGHVPRERGGPAVRARRARRAAGGAAEGRRPGDPAARAP